MKPSVLLVLLLSASTSFATEFKEDDWNLSNDSVTRIESASATCTTNLDRLAKYGIRGSEKTTYKMVRPNHMNSQVLVDTQFFHVNLDKGQKLSRKSVSNNGMEKGFFGGESQYIKKDVTTDLILKSDSELTLRAMDKESGVQIEIPNGSVTRIGDKSVSISSTNAMVTVIDVQSVGNWSGTGFTSSCQLTINFKKFAAKKTKTGNMSRVSYSISGDNKTLSEK